MDIEKRARELAISSTGAPHSAMANALGDAADEIKRLRKAATTAAEIIDKHLNTQREKVTDAAAILRAALADQT